MQTKAAHLLFLYTKHGQGAACKVFKTNFAGGYLRIFRLGKSLSCNPRFAIRGEKEISVDAGTKEKANTNRGTYRLTDNFFRFWYAFGFANLSQLEDGNVEGVYEYLVAPALHEFAF